MSPQMAHLTHSTAVQHPVRRQEVERNCRGHAPASPISSNVSTYLAHFPRVPKLRSARHPPRITSAGSFLGGFRTPVDVAPHLADFCNKICQQETRAPHQTKTAPTGRPWIVTAITPRPQNARYSPPG